MKILYVTTIGKTMGFFNDIINQLLNEGHTVDIATNENLSKVPECYREWGCVVHQIETSRSPLKKGNLKAIKQLKRLVKKEKYDIVHCHTPVAAMCTRLACRKARKKGTKVFYTAHGFHFYKGAPLKNWLLYYPVEKICAKFTDVLITINQEDYTLAQKKLKAKQVEYVPGVGVDVIKFGQTSVNKVAKRKELNIPESALLLLSVGELNKNKNHETVIRAIKDLDVYYIIAGKGNLQEHLENIIYECNMTERVKLLGYRSDVAELYQTADIFILPSIREGLNVSIIEAMASGLPVICGRIRGNIDLIDEFGGDLFSPNDVAECRRTIKKMMSRDANRMGKYNIEKSKGYTNEVINSQISKLYRYI